MGEKRLVRVRDDRVFFGVAGGVARYFQIDPVLVRIVFIVAALLSVGHAILAYALLAILMPQEGISAGKANAFNPEEEIVIKDAA